MYIHHTQCSNTWLRVIRRLLCIKIKKDNIFIALTFGLCLNSAMQTTSVKEEDSGCVDGMSCMSLAECSAQLRSWQQNESDILFRCNYGKQKVCCPLSPRTREKSNMDLLPNEKCGLTSASRISSGHNATFGQFPWMALLGSRCNVHQNVLCRL